MFKIFEIFKAAFAEADLHSEANREFLRQFDAAILSDSVTPEQVARHNEYLQEAAAIWDRTQALVKQHA